MSTHIKKALDKHGLQIPDDDVIKSVDLSEQDGYVNVRTSRKVEMRKLGGVLRALYPTMTDAKLADLVNDIKAAKSESMDKLEFIISDDVYEVYSQLCVGRLASCQTGSEFKPKLAQFYKTQKPNLKILLLYKNDVPIGRALLWSHVEGAKRGVFVDRIYPAYSDDVKKMFNGHAKKNDWTYRGDTGPDKNCEIVNMEPGAKNLAYECVNMDEVSWVPYMDTLKYGTRGGTLSNIADDHDFLFDIVDGVNIKTGETGTPPANIEFYTNDANSEDSESEKDSADDEIENGTPLRDILHNYATSDVDFRMVFNTDRTHQYIMDSMKFVIPRRNIILNKRNLLDFIRSAGASDQTLDMVVNYYSNRSGMIRTQGIREIFDVIINTWRPAAAMIVKKYLKTHKIT
jgi:hypothetical protein